MVLIRVCFFITILLLISDNFYGFFANERTKAHVVIDYNNGEVLSESNAKEKVRPASLTKLMTLFILFDHLEKQKITLETKLKVSKAAAALPQTKLGLPAGSEISVKDAILAVIVRSSNDMARVIAESVAGSESSFVELMNIKAAQLGLSDTHFSNSHGLHNADQYTTAYDMARLSRILMIRHNSYYRLFSVTDFNWNKRNYPNTNRLLEYEGVDGIKTGYTYASGYNLITSASRDNIRVIGVVMGFDSSNGRNIYMKEILDIGFEVSNINRRNAPKYVTKGDNYVNSFQEDDSFRMVSLEEQEDFSENYFSEKIDGNYSEVYTVENIPYVENVVSSNSVSIHPSIKYVTRVKTNKTTKNSNQYKYGIQVGAFSNYKAALNTAYNVVSLKKTSRILKKKNIVISRKNSNYVAKFTSLSKNDAYNACKLLRSSGKDCFVVS